MGCTVGWVAEFRVREPNAVKQVIKNTQLPLVLVRRYLIHLRTRPVHDIILSYSFPVHVRRDAHKKKKRFLTQK